MNLQIDLSELANRLEELIKQEVSKQITIRKCDNNNFEYLSHRKAAALVDQKPETFYTTVRKLSIPVHKFGNRNYYKVEDLKELFIPERTQKEIIHQAEQWLQKSLKK